ncbi:MAG: hypothetical protein IKB88_10860 [Clostridia bacterium]|nr:hypothetical protein [Clostridia bacterium]
MDNIYGIYCSDNRFLFIAFCVSLEDGSVENNGYTYKNLQYGHHERQVDKMTMMRTTTRRAVLSVCD